MSVNEQAVKEKAHRFGRTSGQVRRVGKHLTDNLTRSVRIGKWKVTFDFGRIGENLLAVAGAILFIAFIFALCYLLPALGGY